MTQNMTQNMTRDMTRGSTTGKTLPANNDITRRMTTVLLEEVLGDPGRDVVTDAPLGEEGVGLDSLALVQFLTGVESEFDVEIPVESWSRVDQLSLEECAEAVAHALAR